MGIPLLKRIELFLRKLLLRVLKNVAGKKNPLQNPSYTTAKYLFIRQDRIGDVLVSTPLFRILKQKYPQCTIDVFLSTNNHFVLENNPYIRKRWIYTKRFKETITLVLQLRKERYDYAIDLIDNPSVTSTILCLLSGARYTVGMEKENSYAYDITVPLLSRKKVHIVERLAQLLSVFEINPSNEELFLEYRPSEQSHKFVMDFFHKKGIYQSKKIGINISAGGGDVRFWGISNYNQLINLIVEKYPDFSIIILYSPLHINYAQQLQTMEQKVFLAPVTETFDHFAALIEQLSILITPDTSAVHLASAFKIPTVALYIQSNKNLRIWDPYQTIHEAIITEIDDLKTIPVEEVFKAFERLLQKIQKPIL